MDVLTLSSHSRSSARVSSSNEGVIDISCAKNAGTERLRIFRWAGGGGKVEEAGLVSFGEPRRNGKATMTPKSQY